MPLFHYTGNFQQKLVFVTFRFWKIVWLSCLKFEDNIISSSSIKVIISDK